MKQYHATAVLLAAAMLCTGCAGQGSGASADVPSSAADARTEPAAAETGAAPAETDAAVQQTSAAQSSVPASDAGEPVTDPPVTEPPAAAQQSAPPEYTSPYETVTAEGWFTATVRAKMPDYVTDETTIRAAVLQLFQDIPFYMELTPEICGQLTVGEIYAFHVTEQEFTTEKTNLYEDGTLSPSAVKCSYIRIDSVRSPEEGETGLECWHVNYKPVS